MTVRGDKWPAMRSGKRKELNNHNHGVSCQPKAVAFFPTDNEEPSRAFKQESCQSRSVCVG